MTKPVDEWRDVISLQYDTMRVRAKDVPGGTVFETQVLRNGKWVTPPSLHLDAPTIEEIWLTVDIQRRLLQASAARARQTGGG